MVTCFCIPFPYLVLSNETSITIIIRNLQRRNTSKQTQPLLSVMQTDFSKEEHPFSITFEISWSKEMFLEMQKHTNSSWQFIILYSFLLKKSPASYPLNFLLFWREVRQILYLLHNYVYLPQTKEKKLQKWNKTGTCTLILIVLHLLLPSTKKEVILKRVPAVPSLIPLLLLATNY